MDRSDQSRDGVPRSRPHHEEAHSSEAQLRHLVDAVTEYAIFMLTPEGYVVSWNTGAERIKGYREEEILGRHFSAFYPAEAVEAGLPEEVLEVAAREGQWVGEGWRLRRDGDRFWASVTVTALTDVDGRLQGFAKVTRDMTERHAREEELRRSKEKLRQSEERYRRLAKRYRRLFEEAQEGIAITTPAGEILDINPAAETMLGYAREELLAMNAADLYVRPEERQRIIEEYEDHDAVRGLEVHLQRKSGDEIIVELSSSARRSPDGKTAFYQTFFHEVTEQKRAEAALQRSERRYRRLFEESRDAVILTTPEGTILDANGAAEALFGYGREELLSMDAGRLYASATERERRIVPTLMQATSSVMIEALMRHKDGHTFLASASVTVHRDEGGQPEMIQALVRDISERRRLQREVLRMQEAERRRLGQDLHDGVASQLTGIGIMLGVLARRAEGNEELVQEIEDIRTLVDESCDDVRRLSRGLAPAGLSGKDLAGALERLASNVEGGCFDLTTEDLPQMDDDAATHLYWIAQEAVTNAQKYAEANEIALQLRCNNEQHVVLQVEDDGRGFDGQHIEGGGLGLRTMRYRAELLGAALTIDSAPGEGTRVVCRYSAARRVVD